MDLEKTDRQIERGEGREERELLNRMKSIGRKGQIYREGGIISRHQQKKGKFGTREEDRTERGRQRRRGR